MKVRVPLFFALVATLALACIPLLAHHGTGVAYETETSVTVKGTVSEWIWANPHCGLLFDATDESGALVHWGAELGNPHMLSSAGFGKDLLKPGDKVTITGHPSRSGAPRVEFNHMELSDGRTLTMGGVKGNGEKADTEYQAPEQPVK